MRKVNIYLIGFLCGFIFAIVILLMSSTFLKCKSNRSYDGKSIDLKLPILVKYAALVEREESYKSWISQIVNKEDNDEVKIEKIFNWVKDFPTLGELQRLQELLPSGYKFVDIPQHEYQVLIKQQGEVGEQALNFCNLMTIAGYPASPVYMDYGLVIVRKDSKNFLYFDFGKRKMIKSEEIKPSYKKIWEEKLNEKDKKSNQFFNREGLHGYSQIGWRRLLFAWKKHEDYLIGEEPPSEKDYLN